MSDHRRVLDHFHKRLLAAVTRSSLLKATVTRTGRLLDCSRFESVEDGLSRQIVQGVVEDNAAVPVELRLRFSHGETEYEDDEEERQESPDDKIVREHRAIYDALDRRMRRFAELVNRETGVQALWLGYPLLYVVVGEGETQQWILAPVFLWPISIRLDHRQEGRVLIGRDKNAAPVKFNRAMAGWVNRQLNFELVGPKEDQLAAMSWTDLAAHLQSLAKQFHDPPSVNCDVPLESVPNAKLLNPQHSPRLYNSAVLGIYRWQNEAILADLDELKNRETIDGVASGFTSGTQLPRPVDYQRPPESDRFQVYDADFSQERVIWQTRTEPGLVVHGPPGTGKSQTIVNVIADALAHGRTVLMVCQKYAATRVVFEKLKQVGLDSLCLEVTDSERSRLPVFRAVRDQVDSLPPSAGRTSTAQRTRIAGEIEHLEDELDHYARAMHERNDEVGLAYRQMKTIEGETYTQFPTVRPMPSIQLAVAGMSAQDLESLYRDIEEAGRLFGVGKPLTNPWRFYQPTLQVTAVLKSDVTVSIDRLRELDSQHRNQITNVGGGFEITGDLARFREAANHALPKLHEIEQEPQSVRSQLLRAWVSHLRTIPPDTWNTHRTQSESAVALAEEVAATPLDQTWHERCGNLPSSQQQSIYRAAHTALEYQERWWRFLSLRFRHARQELREFQADANNAVIWDMAREVIAYEQARQLRDRLASANQTLVPNLRPTADERAQIQMPSVAFDEFRWAEWLCQQERLQPWIKEFLDRFVTESDSNWMAGFIAKLEQSQQRMPHVEEMIRGLNGLSVYVRPEALAHPEQLMRNGASISQWLDDVDAGVDRVQSLMAWNLSRSQRPAALNALLSAIEQYETQRHAGDHVPCPPSDLGDDDYGRWWVALVKYAAALAWQGACHQKHPILVAITPEIHAKKVRELQKVIAKKRNLEAEAIRTTWLQEQVKHRSAPWKRMFQLRRSRYGEAKRLREAVSLSLPEGLLAMRPCWLVNPATAAEIFPLEPGLFDLVIFDEASQCPVEQAVPAIFRGKAAVVSGDEKQLPPTSFFSSSWADGQADADESYTEEEATDQLVAREQQLQRLSIDYLLQVEDLLAAAIGNLPERFLSVHYRSRHPALIEFSNRAFYSGRLEAPPAQVSSVNGYRPIRYHGVSGLYERRTNKDEAAHVVKVLRDLWSTNGTFPTVGVVTFNQPQRDLIEDLLEEECLRDSGFDARYRQEVAREEDNQDVGFFVKNLENVQGDERDVMVFSTTFGRDGDGRFYRRFGPVGSTGGERRLNVAVTRAKQQVIVVGSMPIDEVSTALSADLAPGSQLTPASYLQLYLAYAKSVSDGDSERINQVLDRVGRKSPAMTTGEPDSPFEEEVCRVVEQLGFTVHSQVGDSGFRIDLGVVARDPTHGYVLGIECDGATYHSDRSSRLRDVWRAQILRGRGWRLHRIWSTRWWYHRGEEIEALKNALDDASAHLEKRHVVSEQSVSPEPEPIATNLESWQMTLDEWKQRCNELRERGDEDALRALGGLSTDAAHRYRVEQALKDGKPVPDKALADYPKLASPDDLKQQELFDEE